jgi:hypothetical protein
LASEGYAGFVGFNPADVCEVAKDTLTDWFNNGGYWSRAVYGDLVQRIIERGHPSAPLSKEPYCTWSVRVGYFTEAGEQIAQVHEYRRPDGTIGASGKPDPLFLLKDGTLYGI